MENQLDNIFENIKHHIDINEPSMNHASNFLGKLHDNQIAKTSKKPKVIVFRHFRSIMSLAASLVVLLGIFIGTSSDANSMELSKISKEMAHTEDYFKIAIELELDKINANNDPKAEKIIQAALSKLSVLETDYNKLKKDLANSGTDKRVIHAMIQNFQNRIDLLKDVQLQLNETK